MGMSCQSTEAVLKVRINRGIQHETSGRCFQVCAGPLQSHLTAGLRSLDKGQLTDIDPQ